jgi:hypothetical protein
MVDNNVTDLLQPLRIRLASGLGTTFHAARTEDGSHDLAALADPDLARLLDPADDLSRHTPTDVTGFIEKITGFLRRNRPSLLAAVLRTDLLPWTQTAALSDLDAVRGWVRCCWVVEAAWLVVDAGRSDDERFAAGDLTLLRPVAARQRFVVLTEPFRRVAGSGSAWPVSSVDPVAGLAGLTFGFGGRHDVLARCRQSRMIWQRYLNEYQDHPLLASASGPQVEAELDLLLFRARTGDGPLMLSWTALHGIPTPNADDQTVLEDAVDRHLLPRFRILRVMRLGRPRSWHRWVSVAVPGMAALAIILAIVDSFRDAAIAAAGCFLLLGGLVVTLGRTWAAGRLLRLPAASAVGLAALATLHPDWWDNEKPGHWIWATIALVAASYGYLAVEARNHGVTSGNALGRALGVTLIGIVHALLVCLVGLVIVVPEYAEGGPALAAVWHSGGATAWAVLVSGTAWGLAVGVFSQILWDDRPITAPLAHLRWRGGR